MSPVQCKLCGKEFQAINASHLKYAHDGMTLTEYRVEFPDAALRTQRESRLKPAQGPDPATLEKVLDHIRNGMFPSAACRLEGMWIETLTGVLREAEEDPDPNSLVCQRALQIHAACVAPEKVALEHIFAAMSDDWHAAAWFLEHAYPRRWGNREQELSSLQVNVNSQESVQVTISEATRVSRVTDLLSTVHQRVSPPFSADVGAGLSSPAPTLLSNVVFEVVDSEVIGKDGLT